ncbi:MAG TPA: MarR family transcriptional regulator [Opitutaceae bacterium]|nr:MarR family transcriptional regulator [Opitutaceae bacterium]
MDLPLKEVPRYEYLLERARRYPALDPSAMEAFLHLLHTSSDVFEAFSRVLAGHAISKGRFMVLILLNHDADTPVNPADLADRANVTRATMTGLIDTLERDGFVRRENAPDDRRMMLVRLTPRGRTFLDGMLPEYFRRVAALMGRLSETERKTLVALMAKIEEAVPEICAGPPAPPVVT